MLLLKTAEFLFKTTQTVCEVDVGCLLAGVALFKLLKPLADVDGGATEDALHAFMTFLQVFYINDKALVQVPMDIQ